MRKWEPREFLGSQFSVLARVAKLCHPIPALLSLTEEPAERTGRDPTQAGEG